MRVIAGTARSLRLKTPVGLETRPTTDRIKETLFNMLQPHLLDCVFLDLFSGSGGIGIEALSRGAKKTYFVENNTAAFSCIKDNVKATGFEEQAVLLKQDVLGSLSSIREKEVDLIFMDPPYDMGYEEKALKILKDMPYMSKDTLIVVEVSLKKDMSYLDELGYGIIKEKNYKTNKHVFIKIQGE